jgi:hypothetical protein
VRRRFNRWRGRHTPRAPNVAMNQTYPERARPDTWATEPMPARTARLPFTGSYSVAEYERIQRGFIPRTMDDKWFIVEDGGTLSCHRSWTGTCFYQVRLERVGDRYQVVDARLNREVSADLVYEARLLRFLIENLLLGHSLAFPLPEGLSDETALVQH